MTENLPVDDFTSLRYSLKRVRKSLVVFPTYMRYSPGNPATPTLTENIYTPAKSLGTSSVFPQTNSTDSHVSSTGLEKLAQS